MPVVKDNWLIITRVLLGDLPLSLCCDLLFTSNLQLCVHVSGRRGFSIQKRMRKIKRGGYQQTLRIMVWTDQKGAILGESNGKIDWRERKIFSRVPQFACFKTYPRRL